MRKLLFAAAALTLATPALAGRWSPTPPTPTPPTPKCQLVFVPLVCERTWTGEICYQMSVNPSAKIIHIEPFERIDPGTVYVAPDVPLPRPRPPGLGSAPPRQVIQQ